MAAVAIEFDRLAGALARCTAVFTARLRLACTHGILTLVFVCHDFLLKDVIEGNKITTFRNPKT